MTRAEHLGRFRSLSSSLLVLDHSVDRTNLPNQSVEVLKKRIQGGKPQNSTYTKHNINVKRSQSFDINLLQVSSSQIILFFFWSIILFRSGSSRIQSLFYQNTLQKSIENRIFCFHCFLKCMYHSTLWHCSHKYQILL